MSAKEEPTTAIVELRNVVKRYGSAIALHGVDLKIERGEFFSLLGPSGCGKTTLLRLLAGFERPDAGTVFLEGQDVSSIPAHERNVNTVFQSYALFPHMNVFDNVAFGLRMKRKSTNEVRERVQRMLELMRIEAFAARRPQELSGGQRQRVALARALVNEPKVLLLDEPLSALDLKLRQDLRLELSALQTRLGLTFIFVTHDQEEALVMSDRIAVMRAGRIEQVGRVEEIYERPRNAFVAEFLGSANLFRATTTSDGLHTPFGQLVGIDGLNPGREVAIAIRQEKMDISRTPHGVPNEFPARVVAIVYTGDIHEYHLELFPDHTGAQPISGTQGPLLLRVAQMNTFANQTAPRAGEFEQGEEVFVEIPPSSIVVLEDEEPASALFTSSSPALQVVGARGTR